MLSSTLMYKDPIFLKEFGEETSVIFTPKLIIAKGYENDFHALWNQVKQDYIPRRHTFEEKRFIRYLKECQKPGKDRNLRRLEVKHASHAMGNGLFTKRTLRKGSIVGEFAGVICKMENASDKGYLFSFSDERLDDWVIDPTKCGNYTRYMNHAPGNSKDCNVDAIEFFIDDAPHIIMVAKRRIKKGEQLMFDYGEDYWDNWESDPVL